MYISRHASVCAECYSIVRKDLLGKYCVRFGFINRQFCSKNCLSEYKKKVKICSYCLEDISNGNGLLAFFGNRETFKDFCSTQCMKDYHLMCKRLRGNVKHTDKCCVCYKEKLIEHEFHLNNELNKLCSTECLVAFTFVNSVTYRTCDMCNKYIISEILNKNLLIYDELYKYFCSSICRNIYIAMKPRFVSCSYCKIIKSCIDMIYKRISDKCIVVCSLKCITKARIGCIHNNNRKKCNNCHKITNCNFQIGVTEGNVINFCSYMCMQKYNKKNLKTMSSEPALVKHVIKKTIKRQVIPDVPGPLPIITSVRSLAPNKQQQLFINNKLIPVNYVHPTKAVRNIIVIRPPEYPDQQNVATLVKPITADFQVQHKPACIDKAVQTDYLKDSMEIIPIPIPLYVPSPLPMFSLPQIVPIPFPLPIPIPLLIPTTKNTGFGLLKEMKKSHVRTPTDPYEADLLMMAEIVASDADKKEDSQNNGSDIDRDVCNVAENGPYTRESHGISNTFGEEVLQMALKQLDFEGEAVDLEGALAASTITTATANDHQDEQTDESQPIQSAVPRPQVRGRRRGRPPRTATSSGSGGRGRGRGRWTTQVEIPTIVEPIEVQPAADTTEKPDAHMCLKYTFGINAWKQWVTMKNAELEKFSHKGMKPFKTDLLQLTSDELNYSLCLFVKEVRKPNGAEYAPDTIYYLCLGIQQYLFENGRIDNIFCDSYYDSFTDCLNEVCKKFSILYNDSQYIVTRVEEEHLWESKQLGAHSPHVLLSTLMFFNTKHFNLTTVDEHMQLSFSHIMKHWKRAPSTANTGKSTNSRNILLRFYPPQSTIEGLRKKKVYEQLENEEDILRCPVKLYEFYLTKCPESVKTRNDVFYLLPERSCVPDSPVWYSTMTLEKEALEKMLYRVKMVKEINVALLTA